MWSVGTIFAEMASKRPLFPGDSEIDELYKIFRMLGTPNEHTWPGVSALPNYSPVFPQLRAQPLASHCTALDTTALDLLAKMLVYEPARRPSCKAAMSHPYFEEMRTAMAI